MAKNKAGKSKGYMSKGSRKSVSTATRRLMKAGYSTSRERLINQQRAIQSGKDIVVTMENPDKSQTDKPFIKVKYSGQKYILGVKDGRGGNQLYVQK